MADRAIIIVPTMTNGYVPARPVLRDSGQILIITALSMVALLGIAALSLDASFMYDKRNRLHAAADAAAKSAAIEVLRNPGVSQASLEAFADQQVAAHGFTSTRASGTTSVVINHPPIVGPNFIGDVNYVEAIVSEPTSTFFGAIVGWSSMTPTASAIAGNGNPTSCWITNQDFSVGNSTHLEFTGCGVSVGRNLSISNGANTGIWGPSGGSAPSVAVTGTCSGQCTGGHAGSLTTGAPRPVDPLAGLALPTNPGGCTAGTATTLTPGCYTSIAASVDTLQPGIYYVTGDVSIGNNDTLTGNNVMLFLTGSGRINVTGNSAILTLTAPTSGPYKGIAIFQDPANSTNFNAANSFTLDVTGAIYMPGTDVSIANNLFFASTTCTLFIAKSLSIAKGTGTINNSGCGSLFGGAAYLTISIAQ
ncbi:MAG TPA: pilus assembly protein TadG-related protein [Vicinamibacterales bacterium]|nr:pilus assembly protein TadG-related protein [Vicinamibacterales bacterium]